MKIEPIKIKIMKTLKEIKKGDYFKLKENGRIYVKGEYCRDIKKYEYYDYDDTSRLHYKKGDTKVIEDWIE